MSRLTKSYKEHLHARLKDPVQAAGYLNTVLEDDEEGRDIAVFLIALRHVVEARGVGSVAAAAGLNRENVYRMLSDQGNPRLSSLLALFDAVGLKLSAEPVIPKPTEITGDAPAAQVSGRYGNLRLVGSASVSTGESGGTYREQPAERQAS